MTPELMPAAFIGHGSPMNALEDNRYTQSWRALGASLPRPRAILVISAHWFIAATAVTAMAKPRTIHDFYGFPDELFAVRYDAPGSPEIAQEIVDTVAPTWVGLDHDSWGIDHGTWSVLCHMFPDADVPVLQLSINAAEPLAYHFELGARLAPLRQRGVLILGSGNVVHNLGLLDPRQPDGGFAWAERFDEAGRQAMTNQPREVLRLLERAESRQAVPTPEHFLPLAYIAGLADNDHTKAGVLVDGYAMGSLSMTSYVVGQDVTEPNIENGPAAAFPDRTIVPPTDTNA